MVLAEFPADPPTYGEVFTRRWVVDLILDLAGYTPDRDLASMVLVEPSCGTGAFLGAVVDRLLVSAIRHGHDLRSVQSPIRAFDLLEANAELARKVVSQRLQDSDLAPEEANEIARRWIKTDDFLLYDHEAESAHFVVGNPPYIRLEDVPPHLMATYRQTCPTMRGRSDIYVGFIERGLDLLRPEGVLAYICADRWMRNQYGADLRELISESYSIDTVVTMHDTDAFEEDVSAYPAIILLKNDVQGEVNVVDANGDFGEEDAARLAKWATRRQRRSVASPNYEASRLKGWFTGRDLWPTGTPARLATLAEIEARFPLLEDAQTGTRVGIGVATGRDEVFITEDPDLVEDDRLVPLLQAADVTSGTIEWKGNYLVSPWIHGEPVDLDCYPRLRRYLEGHAAELKRRHVAQKRPKQWFRTIDRVDPNLQARPKLVLPDLKAKAHPVLDLGHYYPHHNLYFIISDSWDLEVLGGLLLSDVTNLFIGAYCVRMRGGCYRFQAQYVRRMRVPPYESIRSRDRRALAAAFTARDVDAATAAALKLYGLSELPPLR